MSSLTVRDLTVSFGWGHRKTVAVDRLDLEIPDGTVVGLVGESGSGKSTVARAIVGLVPRISGYVLLDGVDTALLSGKGKRDQRRRIQMIFQDPSSSLNPRISVGEAIGEAVARRGDSRIRSLEVDRLLDLVALDSSVATRLPRQLSGGQRQRVAIARALACEPDIIIADEITSALDASVQGAVLNLVRDLHRKLGLSMLFISHNLATVRYVSDQVAVMRDGAIVETLPADRLTSEAQHAYTRELLASVPILE